MSHSRTNQTQLVCRTQNKLHQKYLRNSKHFPLICIQQLKWSWNWFKASALKWQLVRVLHIAEKIFSLKVWILSTNWLQVSCSTKWTKTFLMTTLMQHDIWMLLWMRERWKLIIISEWFSGQIRERTDATKQRSSFSRKEHRQSIVHPWIKLAPPFWWVLAQNTIYLMDKRTPKRALTLAIWMACSC